ncbi:MAG: hypothetical protein KDK39_10605 [Leptospiraceae bacterium]|nr:hypothetical protein [Leptospiraceae bacterium]
MHAILFFTRLCLYLLMACVPYMLPAAIAVQYDKTAKVTWFFLVPVMMLIAWFLSYRRTRRFWVAPLTAFGVLFFVILFFSEFALHNVLQFTFASVLSYVWTWLVFSGSRGRNLAVLELFIFAFVYFTILNFTRSSEEVVNASGQWIHFVLFLTVLSFLIHSIVLYLVAFARDKASSGKRRRELIVFALIAVPLFLIVSFALPASFFKHDPLETELDDEPPPRGQQLDENAEGQGQRGGQPPQEGNGLPLGDGEKKYPSDRQKGGGSEDQGDVPEQGQRPDEHRGGGQSGKEGQDREGGQGNKQNDSGNQKQNQNQGGEGQKPGDQEGQGGQGKESGQGKEQGNDQKQDQGQSGDQSKDKDKQRLEGIPADQWNNRQQMAGAEGKQFAVMVIASPVQPVYAAREYLGKLDPEKGLLPTPVEYEPLNELARRKLLETWRDQISSLDDKRSPVSNFFLSTESERALAYRPYELQPTILNADYEPFSYSWNVVSRFSLSAPADWQLVRPLSEREKERQSYWLELNLEPAVRSRLEKYNHGLQLKKDDKPFAIIEKILKGYQKHQYKMGFSEDSSPSHMTSFLLDTKEGDCTEFANSTVLLARLNGLPARLVHGYLASTDLQTRYHRGGLKHLQKEIEALQKFKLEELYLVTTSHRHAWPQIWLPGFGWIDFESTAYAIKPQAEFNPNKMDVVIPMIKKKTEKKKDAWQFPWRTALRMILAALFLILFALYTFSWSRHLYFHLRKGTSSKQGLRAYLMLLLMQMARDGYAVKGPHLTPLEYAVQHESLRQFGKLYAELRFREIYAAGERQERAAQFHRSWQDTRRQVKKAGFWSLVRRNLSLRSLYY